MQTRLWRFEAAIFLGLWLLFVGGAPSRFFRDPGTFWHTAIGRQILETGQLPRSDTFTFTVRGQPWISQSWLCEMAMAGLYQVGGWDSLLAVTAILLALVYAWLTGRLYRAGLAGICAVLAMVLAVAASSHQFHVRPVVVTIALTSCLFALLVDVESGRRSLRQLWWLVPLCIVWTNIHGGVLGGLGTLVLVAGGWILGAWLGWESPLRCFRDGAELAGIVAVCGLSVLANPYGLELPRLWFAILRLPLSEFIQEHGPLWLNAVPFLATNALAVLFLGVMLSTSPRRLRVTQLMPLVWLVLAWERGRQSPLFAVITLVALADLLPHSRFARFLAWRGFFRDSAAESGAEVPRLLWRRFVLPLAVLVASLVLQAGAVSVPLLGRGWVRLDPTHWPIDLLPELERLDARDGGQVRIFNEMLYGGFLVFHAPRVPIFVDDRCELYGEAFLRRLARLSLEDPTEFDRWDAELRFSHALVPSGTPIEAHLAASPDWDSVRQTPSATLFRRMNRRAVSDGEWAGRLSVWGTCGNGLLSCQQPTQPVSQADQGVGLQRQDRQRVDRRGRTPDGAAVLKAVGECQGVQIDGTDPKQQTEYQERRAGQVA